MKKGLGGMELRRILPFALIVGFISLGAVFAQDVDEQPKETITRPQPLCVGTRIFTKSDHEVGYQAYYTYLGYEWNLIKIKYELYYHYDELEETEIFTLPVAGNKQAMLNTKPLCKETPGRATKLKITVLDDYGRIRVEKTK